MFSALITGAHQGVFHISSPANATSTYLDYIFYLSATFLSPLKSTTVAAYLWGEQSPWEAKTYRL